MTCTCDPLTLALAARVDSPHPHRPECPENPSPSTPYDPEPYNTAIALNDTAALTRIIFEN